MKTAFKKALAALLSAGILFSAAACGSQSEPGGSSAQGSSASSSGGTKKNDIVIVVPTDTDGFDPVASSLLFQCTLLPCIYDGLYLRGPNSEPIPMLAEEAVNVSDTEWQIKIHEGALFSDGTEITAEDVAFSLMRFRESSMGGSLFGAVENVEPIGTYTVKITTSGPMPALPSALSHQAASIVSKAYAEQAIANDDWSNPVCSGHYTVQSRNVGDSITLVRNENYWNKEDMAQNETLTFKVVPEASSRTIMVESGDADAIGLSAFSTADYDRIKSEGKVALYEGPSSTMYYMAMDTQNEYLSNKLVRQAINYAIDRDACVLAGYDGHAVPLYTCVSPVTMSYLENPGNYSYDVDKAKELMEQAGYADGFDIDLVVSNETGTRVAELVGAYLSAINIRVNIQQVESTSVYVNMAPNGELPLSIATWAGWSDPDMHVGRLFGEIGLGAYNFARFENAEAEELIAAGKSSFDDDVRIDYYEQLQTLLMDECPWCPILSPNSFCVANKDLQGVNVGIMGLLNPWTLHY